MDVEKKKYFARKTFSVSEGVLLNTLKLFWQYVSSFFLTSMIFFYQFKNINKKATDVVTKI